MWSGDLQRNAGRQYQGIKAEVVHLSLAWGNAVPGSFVLQGVGGKMS